jgi:dUTP pyrophosphatase
MEFTGVTIRAFRDGDLPTKQSIHAAGYDLEATEHHKLWSSETTLVGTGLHVEIPHGYQGEVRPRSGLALKHQVTILNSPGTIDADYRGEVKVILHNGGKDPFVVEPGDRIAQLVFMPVINTQLIPVLAWNSLSETDRAADGFGSTGV